MITQISYNVLIERFKAFASGHYLIEGFTHGHPSAIDIQKDITFPWMHVFPIEVEPRAGSRLYSFIITFADLPRDKETPAEYQREVISDCIKLAEDFVAEVQNGLTLFGPTVELEGSPSIEVFIDEYSQTLTGVNLAVTLSVPWDWSACDIPADFAVGGSGSGGGGAGGGGIILKTNGVLNGSQSLLDLVEGTNITITDNGSGVVTISASGALGVSSVGLTMPTAFAVSGSPVTSSGTLAVTGAGTSLEYIDGAGDLQTFPTIPTLTSELTNDSGFITIGDLPPQVNSDWAAVSGVEEILNKPTLAAVATSGDYNDLSNLPTIPTALDDLSDVNAPTPSNGQALIYNSASGDWEAVTPASGGTVTSVALTMPSAFTVGGSPITTAGTLGVTGSGNGSQYIDGTGALQTFPSIPTALPPNGAASGDLSGTYPAPSVHRIHGVDMQSGTPTVNDVWLYGGSPAKWQHQAVKTVNSTSIFGSGNIATGTVTSAGLTSSTSGVTIGSSPVTTSGNITLAIATATAAQNGLLSSTDWATFNGKQNSIGLTTVGTNLATLPNPSAVRYLRINAGNDVSALTLAQLKSDLGMPADSGRAILSSDYVTVGVSFQNVTGLSFAVTAGKTYKWRATILIIGTATTNGTLSTFGPSGTTTYRFTGGLGVSTNNVNNGNANNQVNSQSLSLSLRIATADGIYSATASGTVGISVVSTVAAAITLKAGSIIEYDEVL